jgi:quercetin dioxygenase-like cupin family protein
MREPASTQAVATVVIDNERVRVTEWRFAPGAATGHHRHEYPYVVVPMTTGPLAIRSATGESTASLTAGAPYFRPAGVEHDVINPNPGEFVFVEVECKPAQRG